MSLDKPSGWLEGFEHTPSPHCDARPLGLAPDLLVIHCISLPEGAYGTGHIEALFKGTLDCTAHPSFDSLRGLRVSSHFVISRDGQVTQFVDLHSRAWHAGVSSFQGRPGCNDFSVGIELEGCVTDDYAPQQIESLIEVCIRIKKELPSIAWVAGHSDIAPDRKADPGPLFPWEHFLAGCHLHGMSLSRGGLG